VHRANSSEDVASGSLLQTDLQQSDRIRNFVQAKFNVEDIRELELKPVDSDDDEDDDDAAKNTPGQKIDELYDIINVVGAGAFGIVIACRDRSSNRRFALKIAAQDNPQAATSLQREKKMLSKMAHPNIIRVYELRQQYKNLVIMKMELGKESISSFLTKH